MGWDVAARWRQAAARMRHVAVCGSEVAACGSKVAVCGSEVVACGPSITDEQKPWRGEAVVHFRDKSKVQPMIIAGGLLSERSHMEEVDLRGQRRHQQPEGPSSLMAL